MTEGMQCHLWYYGLRIDGGGACFEQSFLDSDDERYFLDGSFVCPYFYYSQLVRYSALLQ